MDGKGFLRNGGHRWSFGHDIGFHMTQAPRYLTFEGCFAKMKLGLPPMGQIMGPPIRRRGFDDAHACAATQVEDETITYTVKRYIPRYPEAKDVFESIRNLGE